MGCARLPMLMGVKRGTKHLHSQSNSCTSYGYRHLIGGWSKVFALLNVSHKRQVRVCSQTQQWDAWVGRAIRVGPRTPKYHVHGWWLTKHTPLRLANLQHIHVGTRLRALNMLYSYLLLFTNALYAYFGRNVVKVSCLYCMP
jgi:hypothetical protein